MRLRRTLSFLLALASAPLAVPSPASAHPAPAEIVAKLESAYAGMPGYQAEMAVSEYRDGRVREEKSFRYSFRKPRLFRIDMHAPHPGTVLIYSESDGKIVVRPGGVGGFFRVRLAPDNALFGSASGQRLDQTDLGLLIANIGRSVAGARRGEVAVAEREGRLVMEVVAPDHFLPGVLTRYRFFIDQKSWLPAKVVELTPEGVVKREITFRELRGVVRFPPGFFDGGAGEGERGGG